VIRYLNRITPKTNLILIASHTDIEDQAVALLRSLLSDKSNSYAVVLLVTGSIEDATRKLRLLVGEEAAQIRLVSRQSLAGMWAFLRARAVMFTHGLYGSATPPPGQVVINLWHGMPLKRIWSGEGIDRPPNSSYLLSTSQLFTAQLSELSGMPMGRIPITGLPRNDLFFSARAPVQDFSSWVHRDVQRVVFFLPTYRRATRGYQSADGSEEIAPVLMSHHDEKFFKHVLRETSTRVLVKPHPLSPHYGRIDLSDNNFWIISDSWLHDHGLMLYEALGATDGLISDVSSVVVDYLCTHKPCIIYFPDYELYGNTRRFTLEPLEEYLPSRICLNVEELCEEIRSTDTKVSPARMGQSELAAMLNPQSAPSASTATLELLTAELKALGHPMK
jgi:CDP-glycerol glycerophosphotransferase (TagB/SpsB family)